MRNSVGILGTPIDRLDMEAVLHRLESFIGERRFHQVATANTDFLINALADPELRHILRVADLVIADGMPVVWTARVMRSPLPERVAGADLAPRLAELAARNGYSVFMLGGSPDVASRARARLQADFPSLRVVGCLSPPPAPLHEMDNEALLAAIAAARPDILLVAFGNPKQEKWIHLHRDRLRDVPLCIGVGATFDFLAGQVRRAPAWMQRGGLEWLYRLIREPRRLWRRYNRDFRQLGCYLVRQCWDLRKRRRPGETLLHVAQVRDCTVVSVVGSLDSEMLPRFDSIAESAFRAETHLVVDLHGVAAFDGAALGTLSDLPRRAAQSHRELRLVSVPPHILSALRHSHLDDGLYPIAETVAEALGAHTRSGLAWEVCGRNPAVIRVEGVSEPASGASLEAACGRLISAGEPVDLDMTGVRYVDSALLALMLRVEREAARLSGAGRFRLLVGPTMEHALKIAEMTACFAQLVRVGAPPRKSEPARAESAAGPARDRQHAGAPGRAGD